MQPVTFCDRCRVLEVGWNFKYLIHGLTCSANRALSYRLLFYAAVTVFLISVFPTTTTQRVSEAVEAPPASIQPMPAVNETALSAVTTPSPMVASIEDIVGRHSRVDPVERSRIARAIVTSARKYDVDPFLVASILLVESSGDRFAISGRDAVGIMQIHVPTWGFLVDQEQISLFRIEDNIDLGTRILANYMRQYGLWDGVLRYLGARGPSEQGDAYLRRVQGIYSDRMAD